jgi:uncharacterized membrane protein YesL
MHPPETRVPERVWKAYRLSFVNLFYGLAFVIGVIALVFAPSVLTSHHQQDRTVTGVVFIIVGVAFIVEALCFVIFPAHKSRIIRRR